MPIRKIRPEMAEARRLGLHNIGEASAASGVSAKMIREYERMGLIPSAERSFAGYRLYGEADLNRLRFIKRSRGLGFPLTQVQALMALWNDRSRASAQVKQLALAHADALGAKIGELEAMQRSLRSLATACHGDQRPDCPILDDLAG